MPPTTSPTRRLRLVRFSSASFLCSALAAFGWLLCAAASASAETKGAAPTIEQISVGLGGKYKVGYWTPVRLTVKGGEAPYEGKLSLEVPDAEGGPCIWTSPEGERVALQPGEEATIVRYVKFGRLEKRLTAIWESDKGETQRARLDGRIEMPQPTTARHALHLGPPLDWEGLVRQRRTMGREAPEMATIGSVAELPESPLGYDALDFISIATSDLSTLQQCSEAQRAALVEWVRSGGRILLIAGRNGEAIYGADGFFKALLPGKWGGVVRQSNARALEGYVSAEVRLDSVGGSRNRDFHLSLGVIEDAQGRVVLEESGDDGKTRPVIVSAPASFGQIVAVMLDLDAQPFTDESGKSVWASTPVLLERLVDELLGPSARVNADARSSGNLGYSDLAGQFQTALDQFPGVSLAPFSALVALIIAYGVIVTFADYFLIRQVLKRAQWTWLTFPLIAAIFCGTALWFVRTLRSDQPKARQVEIVDIDAGSGRVRGRTWLHLYSPSTAPFQVTYAPAEWKELGEVESSLSWHGMPGKGVGAMDRRALTSVFQDPYVQAPPGEESRVEGLPIHYASSRRLLDEWSGQATFDSISDLKTVDRVYLRGSFVNPLPQALDNVVLVYRSSAYRFTSPIAAGGRQFIDPSDTPMNLNWLVTRRRTVETKDVSTPWDPTSEDIHRLVEMFTFYEAAGAENYTGLANRFYRPLDFSEHAAKGTAVLYARMAAPLRTPQIDSPHAAKGAERELETWTFVRILLPVEFDRTARQ